MPGQWPAGVLLVGLVCLHALRVNLEAPVGTACPALKASQHRPAVTYVVRLENESDDTATETILAAAALGPTIVVIPQGRQWPLSGASDVAFQMIRAGDSGLRQRVHTTAAMVLSVGAIPVAWGVAGAAATLSEDTGWVTGYTTVPYDVAADAPRRLLLRGQRSSIRRAGGVVWEPDATVICHSLLPAVAPSEAAVLGDWLRDGARRGLRGVDTSEVLSRRLGPVEGRGFWARQIQGDKSCAADLHFALKSGPLRAAPAELRALLEELYAWPLVAWAFVPLAVVSVGRFPLRIPAWTFWAAALAMAALGWLASRLAHRMPLHPVREIADAFTAAPGSIAAVFAAVTGRLHKSRRAVPAQPLLIAAGALSLVTTMAFIDTGGAGGGLVAPVAVGLAQLVVLWLFAAHNIAHGAWSRAAVRLHPGWQARLGAQSVRILDASATGAAVSGDVGEFSVGDAIDMTVLLPDRSTMTIPVTVTRKQQGKLGGSLGLTLQLQAQQRTRWIRHLLLDLEPSQGDRTSAIRPRIEHDPNRARLTMTYLGAAALSLVAILGLASLALLGLGLRSVAVSGHSMRPALSPGDLVIEEPVRVTAVREGDVITVSARTTETQSITHRVRSIAVTSISVTLETRGDANASSERLTLQHDATVQRVLWRVPYAGRVLSLMASDACRWAAGVLLAVLLLLAGVGRSTGHASLPRSRGPIRVWKPNAAGRCQHRLARKDFRPYQRAVPGDRSNDRGFGHG